MMTETIVREGALEYEGVDTISLVLGMCDIIVSQSMWFVPCLLS